MEFEPLVSIIIPVYNGSNYLKEAIDSALNQTYGNLEVLVINDGSCDEGQTDQIALSYGDRIKYFSKPNGGVASALNLGIEQMLGEYFSWLSHDDMYFPDKISAQIELLSNVEDKSTIAFSGWTIIDDIGKSMHQVLPLKKYTDRQLSISLFALLHGQINGCSLLIHRSHFERVGIFNEKLPTTQDFDLWFRIMRETNMICHPDALSMIRIHGEQGSKKTIRAHSEACDALWIDMMESLSENEKIKMDGTVYQFYKNIYILLASTSTYRQAISHAKGKYNAELQRGVGKFLFLIKTTGVFLSLRCRFIQMFFTSLKDFGIVNTIKRTNQALRRLLYR